MPLRCNQVSLTVYHVQDFAAYRSEFSIQVGIIKCVCKHSRFWLLPLAGELNIFLWLIWFGGRLPFPCNSFLFLLLLVIFATTVDDVSSSNIQWWSVSGCVGEGQWYPHVVGTRSSELNTRFYRKLWYVDDPLTRIFSFLRSMIAWCVIV